MVASVTNKCLIFKGSYIDNNARKSGTKNKLTTIKGDKVQESLMQQGLDITLFGMGIVFTFLLVLVICTTIMSRLMSRYFPEPEPAPVAKSAAGAADDARLKKIIQEAIKQHRNRRR